MKFNKWTMGLAAVGVVSLASAARADEKMSQLNTAISNTTLSGYVDTSAMWNLGSQNGGMTPRYTPGFVTGDGFNLNAIDIAFDKTMDESPWASGYHVELMYGQDMVGIAGGNLTAIRQAYLALRTPVANSGIDWKVGVWDSPIGYESSSDPLNPNYTRSYGYALEPTTMTGILGTYKANDMLSLSVGIANSFNANVSNGAVNASNGFYGLPAESQKTIMGVIALTAPDSWGWMKGATLNAGIIYDIDAQGNGYGNNADNIIANPGSGYNYGATWYYVGATVPTPMTALKVGAAFDFKEFHNATQPASLGNPSDDSLWALAGYMNYQANDKLSFNLRGEFFDSQAAGAVNNLPGVGIPGAGHMGEELTATVTYNLWANVLSRVELRWDHADGNAFDNASNADSRENGSGYGIHKNAFLLAANLIYQF